ncbi:MAG: glutamine-hydrolyzing carbamoyl-phosphate synthase small subunit [bacterium]
MEGILALSNGRIFRGQLRGARTLSSGEVIFNTAMTGYQEILTDPSYAGQIVTMTYPHIGNCGINPEDLESRQPFVNGLIVKEMSPVTSNWRANESLEDFLNRNNITVLEGIDTRALVIALREQGTVPGVIAPADVLSEGELKNEAANAATMEGRNLASVVSVKEPYLWNEKGNAPAGEPSRFRVIAYDFGIKYSILRQLARRGMAVRVVPFDYPAESVLESGVDGVFLSNGPGDPEPVTEAIGNIKKLLGKVPIFGICLGHQILGLALGGSSYKLKFGHHGTNHPVAHLKTGQVEITSQNHGFALREDALPASVAVTHRSLNDRTVEGIESLSYPAFSVQYHPEASPGPHDSDYLFDQFAGLMRDNGGSHA